MGVLTGPFLIDSPDQWPTLVGSDLVKGWEDAIAADGNLRVLDLGWYVGERHLIGNAAYPEPADLAGVKIRIPPLPAWTTTFEAVGATPVTVDFTEVYTALSQGVVDASEAPLSAINGARWQEVAKEITETGHFRQFQGFVMAESVFAGLPPEFQAILLEEFQAGGERATATEIASAETLRGEFEAQGVTFTPADVEAYRAATAPFYEAYPEWTPGLRRRGERGPRPLSGAPARTRADDRLRRGSRLLGRIEVIVASILLAAMVVLVFTDVLMPYVFDAPLTGAGEVATTLVRVGRVPRFRDRRTTSPARGHRLVRGAAAAGCPGDRRGSLGDRRHRGHPAGSPRGSAWSS